MRILGRKKIRTEGERMPAFREAECLGEACKNWSGTACESTAEWMSADATVTKNRDLSQPPFVDETKYVIYGQGCGAVDGRELVAQHVEVLQSPDGGMMKIIAVTGMYGDMPVQINHAGESAHITTIAESHAD